LVFIHTIDTALVRKFVSPIWNANRYGGFFDTGLVTANDFGRDDAVPAAQWKSLNQSASWKRPSCVPRLESSVATADGIRTEE
jgi:hypothetical protein